MALRIPKSFAVQSQIDQDCAVDLAVVEGKLIITPVSEREYNLDELLAGVSTCNLHQEVRTGEPIGKEVW